MDLSGSKTFSALQHKRPKEGWLAERELLTRLGDDNVDCDCHQEQESKIKNTLSVLSHAVPFLNLVAFREAENGLSSNLGFGNVLTAVEIISGQLRLSPVL